MLFPEFHTQLPNPLEFKSFSVGEKNIPSDRATTLLADRLLVRGIYQISPKVVTEAEFLKDLLETRKILVKNSLAVATKQALGTTILSRDVKSLVLEELQNISVEFIIAEDGGYLYLIDDRLGFEQRQMHVASFINTAAMKDIYVLSKILSSSLPLSEQVALLNTSDVLMFSFLKFSQSFIWQSTSSLSATDSYVALWGDITDAWAGMTLLEYSTTVWRNLPASAATANLLRLLGLWDIADNYSQNSTSQCELKRES